MKTLEEKNIKIIRNKESKWHIVIKDFKNFRTLYGVQDLGGTGCWYVHNEKQRLSGLLPNQKACKEWAIRYWSK